MHVSHDPRAGMSIHKLPCPRTTEPAISTVDGSGSSLRKASKLFGGVGDVGLSCMADDWPFRPPGQGTQTPLHAPAATAAATAPRYAFSNFCFSHRTWLLVFLLLASLDLASSLHGAERGNTPGANGRGCICLLTFILTAFPSSFSPYSRQVTSHHNARVVFFVIVCGEARVRRLPSPQGQMHRGRDTDVQELSVSRADLHL